MEGREFLLLLLAPKGSSSHEREVNQMLNRVKEALAKASKEVIQNEQFLSIIVESVSTGIVIFDEKWLAIIIIN